jgi:two-component system response regulator (stage 0 sporulation protein A)
MLTALGRKISPSVRKLGADYYILKPFNMDVLINRVRQLANASPPATGATQSIKARPSTSK